jgi:hypothetical protein
MKQKRFVQHKRSILFSLLHSSAKHGGVALIVDEQGVTQVLMQCYSSNDLSVQVFRFRQGCWRSASIRQLISPTQVRKMRASYCDGFDGGPPCRLQVRSAAPCFRAPLAALVAGCRVTL